MYIITFYIHMTAANLLSLTDDDNYYLGCLLEYCKV